MAWTLAQTQEKSAHVWLFCPWLKRFSGANGLWLSVLAAHDANGTLLEALPPSGEPRPNVYAGVFAIDPLRTSAQLIRHIKRAGVGGVINLPSISFIDGKASATFEALSLGAEREVDFLNICAKHGLRIAGVVGSALTAKRWLSSGADFLIAHGGPPVRDDDDPSKDMAERIAKAAHCAGVPVVPMSSVRLAPDQAPKE